MLAPSILSKKIRLDTPPIVDEARWKDTTRRLDRFGREVVRESEALLPRVGCGVSGVSDSGYVLTLRRP